MNEVKLYKHYKGGSIYELLYMAIHSETQELMAVYKDKDGVVWIRPAATFYETLNLNGERVRRFTRLSQSENDFFSRHNSDDTDTIVLSLSGNRSGM